MLLPTVHTSLDFSFGNPDDRKCQVQNGKTFGSPFLHCILFTGLFSKNCFNIFGYLDNCKKLSLWKNWAECIKNSHKMISFMLIIQDIETVLLYTNSQLANFEWSSRLFFYHHTAQESILKQEYANTKMVKKGIIVNCQ